MTVAKYYHDKPFAMLNWHRNWCEKQTIPPFCILRDSIAGDVKRTWENCPHRQMCFMAFINSDATKEKGAAQQKRKERQMADTKNALAELARDLIWIEAILCSAGYAEYSEDANKAQRIITELAKVKWSRLGNLEYPHGDDLLNAIRNSRAIAEEGSEI